ncbi:hypothetical protein CY0110_18512 [Crocosphaera chwakensis CCY0110]|uniref:Uncharacterized protein n=1 Tax=Crocosphaera chwakensis CCY0110 TaxID=391612 RepID=A3IJ34_9CHRO|nr:hypothetical protein CY0110_18512 [Crocosphaera chwakensis CCY0110]
MLGYQVSMAFSSFPGSTIDVMGIILIHLLPTVWTHKPPLLRGINLYSV